MKIWLVVLISLVIVMIAVLFAIWLVGFYRELCTWLYRHHMNSGLNNDEYDYGHNVDNHDHDYDS